MRLAGRARNAGGRHKGATDSGDQRAMLSIARVWSFLIHVPFLGGALILFLLWKLVESRLPKAKGRR